MIYVGIDVAKVHDCFITNSGSEFLFKSIADNLKNAIVGLEATGHYSYKILRFLLDKSLTTFITTRYIPIFSEKSKP